MSKKKHTNHFQHLCIDNIRKQLMQNKEIKGVYFDLSTIAPINYKGSIQATAQAIEIMSEKKTRNGELKTVVRKSFVSHNFCPFCGKSYNDMRAKEG